MVEQSRARRGLGRRSLRLRHRLSPPSLRRLLSLLVLLFLLLLFRRFRRPLRAGLRRRGDRRAGGLRLLTAGRRPGVSPVGLLEFVFFGFRHRYLTRGIGWPDLTAIRSTVPSLSSRRRTRVGSPDFGSRSITLDAAMGAGNSMIPLSLPGAPLARLCFFTTFPPSTTTRNCLGWTRRILPSLPRCSPRMTRTVSPLATWSLWRSGSRPRWRRLLR